MGKFGTGQAIRRVEDQRFLTGTGTYTDDINLDGQLFLYLFRSPYAHGLISALEVSAAKTSPGVVAVYTSDDLQKAGVRDLTGANMPASSMTPARDAIEQPALARDKVRYVGEPVAAVIATSPANARDAAELIEFDVNEIDPITSVQSALLKDAPLVHETVAGNSLGILEYGDKARSDSIFASASTVAEINVVNNRLAPTAMEPRGCVADFDAAAGQVTLYQGCQGVHALRDRLLHSFDLQPEQLHVISPDVGGAFGLKFFLQCETVVAVFAAMDLARPVKWTADRTESFLADLHGRDHVTRARMALDSAGRFLAMNVSIVGNTGAYCSQAGPFIPWFGACMTPGCYDIEAVYVDVQMALTNTVPVDAYRGAGRPEAAYVVERLVDESARISGLDVDEIRRRNFIRPEQFPYRTATGRVYDSGNYEELMDAAMLRARWQDFDARRDASAAAGKLRGIGLSYYVEICSAMGGEDTHITIEQDGRVTILMGTQSSGQGHETSFAQMVADGLGVPLKQIDVIQGDSKRVPTGEGTGGSRSMAIGGSSLFRTVASVIDNGRKMAAELLEAAEGDIEFDNGRFRVVGTDHGTDLIEVGIASHDAVARPEGVNAGLYSTERFAPEAGTFPNGCHICELEIDPATGDLEIVNYVVEDDVGVVVNPLILEGQIMGGVAQGLGQAICEHAVYESENGQLLTATFMDYAMPRADRMPDIRFNYQEVPSPRNPLGIKGAGEAGTVGAAPALVNAAINAVASLGIDHLDMPLTPMSLWQALQEKSPDQS